MPFLEDEKKLNLRAAATSAKLPAGWWDTPVESAEKSAKFMDAADFDAEMEREARQARKEEAAAVEVERDLPGEVGASLVRGGLGIAKLVPQVGKIVGSDILGPVVKGITGTDLADKAFTPMIEGLEEIAESPEWKPSKEAGGAPIDLERIVSNPGEVIGQITSQITNPRFWASQLPEGAMSMIPAIVGAWAPRAAAAAGKLGVALEAAKVAGDTAKVAEISSKINRLGTIGMYGASMAMEAGQGEEKVREYEEKTGEKISWGSRVASILGTGIVAGGLEAFSLGRVVPGALLGRKGTSPLAVIENVLNGKGGREIVNKVLAGVATEGLTEGAQTIVENAFPRGFFDKNQKLLEGVVESMLIGAALGGLGGGAESISTHREAGAFARESGEFSKEFQDTAARIQDLKKKANEEYWAQFKPVLPEKPPEPVLAPGIERPGPQPTELTPEEQHQAIFGGELGRIAGEQPTLAAAVDNLAPLVGSTERAERFYDLYQQGDAVTALQEFPEFSSFATEQQKEAAITPAERAKGLPSAFTGRPRPTTQAGPMGVTAGMAATRATPVPGAADTPTPGSPPLPGTAASGPTTPPAPMGVTGGMAHTLATRRGEESGTALVEEALVPIRDQAALRDQVLDRTGGIIPQTRLRRMAMQEIEGRLARGEEVEPEVLARFPELAKKYEAAPVVPGVEAAAPVTPQEALEVEDWAEGAPPLPNAPDETGIAPPEASDASTEGIQEGGTPAIVGGPGELKLGSILTDGEDGSRWEYLGPTDKTWGPARVYKIRNIETGQENEVHWKGIVESTSEVAPPSTKSLPAAITGKKVGPVAGAKPTAPRGVGLHPGITGKPAKNTPAPTITSGENVAPAASEKVAPEMQAGRGKTKVARNAAKEFVTQLVKEGKTIEDNFTQEGRRQVGDFKVGVTTYFEGSVRDPGGIKQHYQIMTTRQVDDEVEQNHFDIEELFKEVASERKPKPLPSAITGKKAGTVAKAKPVAKHPGLPKGIGGKPKIAPAAPTFKAGDRVSWTERGKTLTGTLDDDPYNGEVNIQVDQIATIGGRIPILRKSLGVKVENLTKLEEASATPEPKPEAPPAQFKVGDTVHAKPSSKVPSFMSGGRKIAVIRSSDGWIQLSGHPEWFSPNSFYPLEGKVTEPVDISKKEPTISTTEATAPEGGKGNEATSGSAEVSGDGEASPKGQGPASVSGTAPKRQPGKVRGGTSATDEGSSQGPALRNSDESEVASGEGKEELDRGSSDDQHGAAPGGRVHPGNVSGVPDFSAGPGDLKREGSWKETARRNLDIIQLVKQLDAEGRQATPEQQALIAKYVGWGATEIANNLFDTYSHGRRELNPGRAREGWGDLVQRAQDLLTPEELETAVASTRNAHYTSEAVVRSIFDALSNFNFKGGRILEPGMGIGNFPILMPKDMRDASSYTGLELDHLTAAIAKHLLPNQNVLQGDYVKQAFPDNFFDLGIGNPPFADTKILGDPAYAKYRFSLHDYFFAKTLDKIRPGGLMVFITSRYTMDKGKDMARKYLAERADLIGAIRLPQTAFKANAGTEVVTDVLFFRKRAQGEEPGGEPWLGHAEIELPYTEKVWEMVTGKGYQQVEKNRTKKVLINEYFAAHPEMVLGEHSLAGSMYGSNEYTVTPKDGDIEAHFAEAVKSLPENVYSIATESADDQKNIVYERDFNPKAKKEGQIYVDDKNNLMIVDKGSGVSIDAVTGKYNKGELTPIKLTAEEKTWLKGYVELRDALKTAQYDQLGDLDWKASLKELNRVYDAFVKKHGPVLTYTMKEYRKENEDGEEIVTSTRHLKYENLFSYDVEGPLIYALEKINSDTGEITKGTVLTERTIEKPVRKKPETPAEALAITLDELGRLDLDRIATVLNLSKEQVIEDLGSLIYEDPTEGWQTADAYLSGNVVQKLEEAEVAALADPRYQRNVEALRAVQPIPLTPAEVDLSLGASWIPAEHINQFAHEVLEMDDPGIEYESVTHVWNVKGASGKGSRSSRRISDWSTEDRSSHEILDAVLNNRDIKIKRTVTYVDEEGHERERKVVDVEATTKVHDIMTKMKDRFGTWFWQNSERSAPMLDLYNRRFNNLAGREYNGDHLTLPGFTALIKLMTHQMRAIWRMIQSGNTYLAHAVGSGKTFVMVAAGMEMKRLGLIQKPLYVVPNHMLGQAAAEFMQAYPMANIMVASEQNFHKNNRRRFMAQAALNKPDAIIVTHSAFGLIGMKPESVADLRLKFVQDLEDLEDALIAEDPKGNRRQIKQVQKRIDQMNQRFDKMTSGRKDNALTFEEMGVDFVFVDEAHEFRKLDFTTNQDRIKGVSPDGSQKALDLYAKVNWLEKQRPGRSHVFASGTPITNTLGELYTVMRYFDDGSMARDGLHYFDAWASMFGRAVEDYELNAAGNVEPVTRFSQFVNLPELGNRVRQFMDVLTTQQLSGYVDLPIVEGGPQIILAPKSPEYKNYQDNVLKPRIEESRKFVPTEKQPGNPDPLLAIITDGRLGAIDMRFHGVGSLIPTKLEIAADKIAEEYHAIKDLVYFTEDDKGLLHEDPIKGGTQIVFYNVGFGANVRANRRFDSRKALMDRLKKGGVPAREVAWIDDYTSAEAKENLYRKMRSGEMKVLIGSAPKMSTGLNIQKRLCRTHYIDPPWFPSLVQQADGRMVRQKNQNQKVKIFRYATKGSYDATQWGMVARKAEGIEKFLAGDRNVRTLEDISEVSHYQMAAAQATGDQRHIKVAQLKGAIQRFKQLYGQWQQDQRTLASDARNLKTSNWSGIPGFTKALKDYQEARKVAPHIWPEELNAKVGNQAFNKDTRNAFGVALVRAYNTRLQDLHGKGKEFDVEEVLGTLNGHEIVLDADGSLRPVWSDDGKKKVGEKLSIQAHLEIKITKPITLTGLIQGSQFDGDPSGLVTRMINAVNNLRQKEESAQRNLNEAKAELKRIERQMQRPFEYTRDLKDAEAELKEIQDELAAEGVIANAVHSHAQPGISPEMGQAIADGEEMERTATMRTGPTIATAMRQAVGSTRYSLAGRAGLGGPAPGEGPTITLQAVQERFGGVKVHELEGGKGFHLTLPNGKLLMILTGQDLTARRDEILATYGREMKAGEWVAGEWRQMSVGGVVALAKGAGIRTLDHETFHAACDLVLRQKELDAILKKYGDWETAARAYESWKPAESHKFFQRILNFFRRLAGLLGPTAEGTFAKIKSGEVWVRTEAGPGTGTTGAFNAVRTSGAEAVLDDYHRTLMAQDPANKSLWRRFWDKDPALKASWTEMSQKAYDQVVDRFAPGERAQEKLAKAGIALPAGEQFTSTIGFWRGQEGWNHEAVLGSGIYTDQVETLGTGESFFTGATPERVGDSLFTRVDPIRTLAKSRNMENKEVFRDLRLLMVANRDMELAGEFGTRTPGTIKGVRPDESRAALDALAAKYGNDLSTLQEIGGKWNTDGTFTPGEIQKWADQAILQRLLQAGVINRKLYNKIKGQNQAYIPFARLMDEVDQYIKATGGGKVIKEIKGSERAIVDPFEMLIELSAKANYAYAKNRMIRSLYQMGQASPEMGVKELKPKIIPSGMAIVDKWDPLGKSGWAMAREIPKLKKGYAFSQLPPEPGAIPFYKDGKRSWLKLPPDLHGMMQNLLPEDLGLLMRVLKWPADVLRTGAVTTPEFGLIKNPLRDLVQAWLFNRAGFSPFKWWRDLYLTLSKDPATVKMKAEMAAGGGFMATLAQSTVDEKITAADIEGKKKNIAYAAHPVEALRTLSAYLENLTRFSLYKQARENGLSHAEAIHEARRTTLDFRRLGAHPVARYLNMIIPFWNANIQGIDKLVTELKGPNKAKVWRRLGTLAAASIGLALLFHDDDRLKELEDWEKNYFWHIPLGKTGPIIRLPKPFEAGILFGSIPERLVEVAMGNNTTGLQAAVKAAFDVLTPEMIPAILRPMVELKSNYNFFLGRPIEDAGLQNLPVELRSKPWTTALAKAISVHGGNLIGLSPVKIEHFVRSFSGGLGANYYFPGADLLLRKAGVLEDLPNPQQDAIERAFGIRALFTKPPAGYRAKSVGNFFENVQDATRADQGWKLLWNTGSMDKLDAFLKDNPEAMFARVARKQMAELGKIKKERNAIHLSKTLTSEQKRAKLDALDEKIVTIARAGNALMDPAVAEAVKMPARKGMDFESYKKMTSEFVGDAYDIIQKNLPKIVRMEEAQRQRYLIKVIRQAREEYKPVLKKPKDETKLESPYDKATRAERARWQSVMGFRKAKTGEASGYRLKEETP